MNRRITQADVAKAANVSRSIVSLVINGRDAGRVSEQTRQAVIRAIKELGYAPNAAARILADKKSYLIGVFTYEELFPYAVDDFFHAFLVGIEHQASREEYNLLLFTRKGDYSTRSIYQRNMNVLGTVDGSILMGSHPKEDEIRDLVRENRPFVYIGKQEIDGCTFDWVASDYQQGGYLATKHLLTLGHRRIGLLGLLPETLHDRSKLDGCEQAVHGAPDAKLSLLPREAIDNPTELVAAIRKQRLTALICNSNHTFSIVSRILQTADIHVPEHLSMASLSDERVNMPIDIIPSTVHLNRPRVGREAVKLLVERLRGERQEPTHALVPCSFVPGNSTSRLEPDYRGSAGA